MRRALVLVATAILALGIVMALIGAGGMIDCGPEGIPALDGTACIDREPVYIP